MNYHLQQSRNVLQLYFIKDFLYKMHLNTNVCQNVEFENLIEILIKIFLNLTEILIKIFSNLTENLIEILNEILKMLIYQKLSRYHMLIL